VLCEECNFSLKATYIQEEQLKDGQNKLFHLKSGDKKVFILDEFFESEKEWIQISSFNLRMSKYSMNVEIAEKQNPKNVIEVPVHLNWIGGQQAIIKPNNNIKYTSKYVYRIILNAEDNGVFNIEARTSHSLIELDDKTVKFETVKKDQNLCYQYSTEKSTSSKIILEARSIKGDIEFTISNKDKPSAQPLTYKITNEKELNTEFENGNLIICVHSNSNQSFFSLQVFLESNSDKVKEYKQLLYRKFK
jgi:hypothetical protein